MTLSVHGIKVPFGPTDVSPEIWRALSTGTYEDKEARWIFRAVLPHDRVLELGSGVGILTSLIARIEGVQVWAFEANPSSFRLARSVLEANDIHNVELVQGMLTAGPPRDFVFYVRKDLWMSSIIEQQGPYEETLSIRTADIDRFVAEHSIDVVVMDIEGSERGILVEAELPGVERIFVEMHDHLYGLAGIREITSALALKGFAYDPRGSSGPCVLFSRSNEPREYWNCSESG